MKRNVFFSTIRLSVTYLLVIIGIFLLSMFPRSTNQVMFQNFDVTYNFSIATYFNHVKTYFAERLGSMDLGLTVKEKAPVLDVLEPYLLNSMKLFLPALFSAFLLSSILCLILHRYLQKYADKLSDIDWVKSLLFFCFILFYCFISAFGNEYSFGQTFFLLVILLCTIMILISIKEFHKRVRSVREVITVHLLRLRSIMVASLSSLLFVEWLTDYKGFATFFIQKAEYSHITFARSFSTHEYELVAVMVLILIVTVFAAEWIAFATKAIAVNKGKGIRAIPLLFGKHLIITGVVFALVLFPKSGIQEFTLDAYVFSMDTYKKNMGDFITNVTVHQTLGETKQGFPIEDELIKYFPRSMKVIISAFFISLFIGIAKGIFDFQTRKKWYSFLGKGSTWFTSSFPDFFLILLLQWFLIIYVSSLKIIGHGYWYSFLLMAILVSIHPIMYVASILCNSLEDIAGEPFIQVAMSKGLSRNYILRKHMLKHTIVNLSSYFPAILLYIMSNLLIVEWFFDFRGAAHRLYVALENGPYVTLSGALSTVEGPIIFVTLAGFLLPLFLIQIFTNLLKAKYSMAGRE